MSVEITPVSSVIDSTILNQMESSYTAAAEKSFFTGYSGLGAEGAWIGYKSGLYYNSANILLLLGHDVDTFAIFRLEYINGTWKCYRI